MRTGFIYDCVPRFMHSYVLNTSRGTGKERDAESGLDYFGARHYSSMLGRFMSPDWSTKPTAIPYANMNDPQALNLYSYVGNNPMSRADADGHCDVCWSLVGWIARGIGADGGKGFAKNIGICVAKGTGSFVYNTVMGGVALSQGPAAIALTMTSPGPSALRPSNLTQAQVSATTQVALTVASALAPGSGASGAAGASSLSAEEIQAGLAGASLRTTQSEISGPVVNRFIDMLNAGEEAPPIKVDGDIIVDGNHRYAAGVLSGDPPATTSGTVSPSQVPKAKPFKDIKVDSQD